MFTCNIPGSGSLIPMMALLHATALYNFIDTLAVATGVYLDGLD